MGKTVAVRMGGGGVGGTVGKTVAVRRGSGGRGHSG